MNEAAVNISPRIIEPTVFDLSSPGRKGHAFPEPDVPRDATDANSARAQRKSRPHLPRLALLDRPPSKLLAVRTGTRKPGHHPFADHGALKLGKDPKHLEHRLARRRGSVEALLVEEEVNAFGVKIPEKPQ